MAKLKDQFEIAMALYDHYVEPLFAAREIFVGPDLVLYERTPETPFLYVPIDMKRWSREDDKKASDPLRRWVANEIELRASKVVKDLWKKTSKVGWGHLQDKIDLASAWLFSRVLHSRPLGCTLLMSMCCAICLRAPGVWRGRASRPSW